MGVATEVAHKWGLACVRGWGMGAPRAVHARFVDEHELPRVVRQAHVHVPAEACRNVALLGYGAELRSAGVKRHACE
jgi:hypothetical protein